jgi:hypothetical protein
MQDYYLIVSPWLLGAAVLPSCRHFRFVAGPVVIFTSSDCKIDLVAAKVVRDVVGSSRLLTTVRRRCMRSTADRTILQLHQLLLCNGKCRFGS